MEETISYTMEFLYTSCEYDEWEMNRSNEDSETDSEAERKTKIEREKREKREEERREYTRAFWKEISDDDERTREAWRNPLYPTMVNLALTMINKKKRLLYEQFSNEDDEKDRRHYNYIYDNSDMYYELGFTDKNIRDDTAQSIKLLLNYNKYNKLNVLKTKTRLNNDIIFNIIIKYMP